MNRILDSKYKEYRERLAKGKKHLEGKWGFPNRICEDTNEPEKLCIERWHVLADTVFEQMCIRGEFQPTPSVESLMQSADEKVERIRQILMDRGILKQKKERRKKIDTATREINGLFQSQ